MRIIVLLVSVMMFCSCQKNKNANPFFQHILQLHFQDVSGADLVKDIGYDCVYALSNMPRPDEFKEFEYGVVKADLYTLDVIFGNHCEDSYYAHYNNPACAEPAPLFPTLMLSGVVDGKYYLEFTEFSVKNEKCSSLDRKITFILTCPYVFGDDKEHEIVTFWKAEKIPLSCYRIEFDDKEITEIEHVFNGLNQATIILDR